MNTSFTTKVDQEPASAYKSLRKISLLQLRACQKVFDQLNLRQRDRKTTNLDNELHQTNFDNDQNLQNNLKNAAYTFYMHNLENHNANEKYNEFVQYNFRSQLPQELSTDTLEKKKELQKNFYLAASKTKLQSRLAVPLQLQLQNADSAWKGQLIRPLPTASTAAGQEYTGISLADSFRSRIDNLNFHIRILDPMTFHIRSLDPMRFHIRSFDNSSLEDSTFEEGSFEPSSLEDSSLEDSSFQDSSLTEETFSKTTSQKAAWQKRASDRQLLRQQLGRRELQKDNFRDRSLEDETFSNNSFEETSLEESSFEQSNFEDSNLEEETFSTTASKKAASERHFAFEASQRTASPTSLEQDSFQRTASTTEFSELQRTALHTEFAELDRTSFEQAALEPAASSLEFYPAQLRPNSLDESTLEASFSLDGGSFKTKPPPRGSGKIPACLLHLDRDQLGQLDWLKLRQLA